MAADAKQKAVPPGPSRIAPKDAAIAAAKYFMEVTGYTGGVTVEEVSLSEDHHRWVVTLGYFEPPAGMGTGGPTGFFGPAKKAFKVFEIDAKSGEVLSMKIREA